MLLLPLRWLFWLLALSVPAQASAGAWLRAQGPAHLHIGATGASDGRYGVQVERPGQGHAHGHAGSRIEAHAHDLAEAGVVYVGDGGDAERGGSPQSTDKAAALDPPMLLPAALLTRCEPGCGHLRACVEPGCASVAARPLYRPPR